MKFEKLGNIVSIQIGKTPKRDNSSYWGKGYLWVSIADLKEKTISKTKEEITELAIKECGCKLIPKGTLLLSFKLSIGKLAFAGHDLYTNEAICGLTILDESKVSAEYLYYALRLTKLKGSNVAVKGATLNTASLKAIKIPLPEKIEDQHRIATILSKAEALITQRKQSIALLDDYLKSTFWDMFGDPVRNEKGWEKNKVEKYTDCIVPGRDKPKSFTGEIPWIRTEDLINKSFFENSKESIGLSREEIKIVKGRTIPIGSVVMTCVGQLNVISINQKECIINQQLHSFQCKEMLNNIFLMYSLSFQEKFMYNNASTTTVAYMNKTICNSIPTILPPLPLQNQFAAIVQKIEGLKKKYQQSLVQLQGLFGSLSQRGFKGELDLKSNGDFKFNPALERDIEVPARIKFKKTIKLEDEFTKEKAEEDDYIVKHLGKWLKIKPAKVKYVEANKPYVTIVYENDIKYLVRTSMNDFLKEKLFKDILIRVHQSIAVNKNQIQKIKTITTLKGEELPISIKNKKIVYNNSFTNSTENKKKNPIIDLLPILGKSTNLPFNYNEGKSIVKKYFSKKTGFSFKEFKDTVIKVGFTATFTDLKSFIFEALNEKILIQFYASKEYMQSIPSMQYSSHSGAEFVGDGSIWFLVPQNVATK